MARPIASLPAGSRITDYIRLGVIAQFFPAEKVHEMLKETNCFSIRERDLPAQVVVYSVIALALSMRSSYREVLRCLLEAGAELPWLTRRNPIGATLFWNQTGTCRTAPTSVESTLRHPTGERIAMPSWREGSTITRIIYPRPIRFIG
jgi:hypothetical protein